MSRILSERDKELSLMQHLTELRNRLMITSFGVLIATAIAFVFAKDIILALEAPAHLGKPLQLISPTEGFTTYMRVSLFTGIALAMPVILYEIYAYVDPALRPKERRFLLTLGPFVLLLFVGGMAFCYFLLLPNAINFLFTFGSDVFEAAPRASEYISFVTTFILGVGLVFEMPVIIFAVTRIGLVKRSWLAKQRRYVFLMVFVLGAIITPTPDPFNQSLVAIPMYLLFEVGMLLSRFGGEPRRAT
ncbi:MAG TPA: twin-arginine translocase subunit TatC [Chloroflexi bacterium]|nr:twin-arginine translocase subunit TatC [Chloroflexota bacterium]HAL27368.1 twin-arginine translocase subunit TatC [Chloroflexota bacterium]